MHRRLGAMAVAGAAEMIVVDGGSTRRWDQIGFWRATLVYWYAMALDALGWPRECLARSYGVRGS